MAAALARGEIIDRIAVTIDHQVITESQVIEEIRTTAFLNGDKPDLSPANKRKAADRMVDQALFAREMQLTRYPQPTAEEIGQMLKEVQSRFTTQTSYARELATYRVNENLLKDALRRQLAVIRFIELRFRPEVQVQEAEIEQYYEKVFLPEARRHTNPVPSLDEAHAQCEEALAAQMVDQRVERWLKEMRARTRIEYREDAIP